METAAASVVADRVRDIPDFPRAGIVFKDITPLLADAGGLLAVCADLAARHTGEVDLVAGVEARGFIIGALVARELGVGFIPIRKEGKLPAETVSIAYELEYGEATIEVHADSLAGGERVLLVDDVLATGGTAAAAWDLLARVGAEVVALDVVIELAALGGRARLGRRRVEAVLTA